MNIIGIDLDGVIFDFPFLGFFKRINLDYFIYRVLRKVVILKKAFYRLIKADARIIEILERLAEGGWNKIVIISGHSEECLEEVEGCLRQGKVPFDKLCLCPKGEKLFQFKLKKIIEERCDFYIEDQKRVVRFLRERLKRCQVIHYKNHQSLFELKKLLKL